MNRVDTVAVDDSKLKEWTYSAILVDTWPACVSVYKKYESNYLHSNGLISFQKCNFQMRITDSIQIIISGVIALFWFDCELIRSCLIWAAWTYASFLQVHYMIFLRPWCKLGASCFLIQRVGCSLGDIQ